MTSRQDQKYVQDALDIQEITEFNPDAVLLCGNFPYEQIKTLLPNFKIIAEEWE